MTSESFASWYRQWQLACSKQLGEDAPETNLEINAGPQQLLELIHAHSPYLRDLLMKHPDIFTSFISCGAEESWQLITIMLDKPHDAFHDQATLQRHLRITKQRAALLIALADISNHWGLAEVTMALSQLADQTVELALQFLLKQAANKGDITLHDEDCPTKGSGIIVLGMGKLGANELNYSSDIDLIIFYEAGRLAYHGRHNEQHLHNKIAQGLVTLMQERTADGYVFRTDLRLRPDPSSTPLAVSTDAALQYYESLGQNWERAAMIKARAIAGDLKAGERMLQSLGAYVWRKSLDFASVQDILSIKRQISKKIGIREQLYDHNIKLGKGGIREIEFFTQIHQLIWGGRQVVLRGRETLRTLSTLVELEHISQEECDFLTRAYTFYRKLEHRLQMIEDQQTHSLPSDDAGMESLALFMGSPSRAAFLEELQEYISGVHRLFIGSFEAEGLSAAEGNLVFTGTNHDPETLETLRNMGFKHPEAISQSIMDWHRGSRRCTRSKVARQLLTELVPDILTAFSNTVHPNGAFTRFDRFLLDLPVGIQLFSLIHNNPDVLHIIADIMGTAPTLSETLSRRPQLIETTLFRSFRDELADKATLKKELDESLLHIEFYDAAMEQLRQFKNEKHFKAGVQLLRDFIDSKRVGDYLSDLADILIDTALKLTLKEFATEYGTLEGSGCCIIALGKLGSRELTFGSDVDLMFVYDCPDSSAMSNGKRSYAPSVYYNRLCQRIVSALTTVGTNGALYEVDTRLRPAGQQGLLAVSKPSIMQYFSTDAWTFERMALCKARAMAGDEALQAAVEADIGSIITAPREAGSVRRDITHMRERVSQEYGTDNVWSLKHTTGGLMDIDFVAQYIVLALSHDQPGLNQRRSCDVLEAAIKNRHVQAASSDINPTDLQTLLDASIFLSKLQHMLRLTSENPDTLDHPPAGLADVLTTYMQLVNYQDLKETLEAIEKDCREAYISVMQVPQ